MVTVKAYAKINLGLDVIGRLENGYHVVKMVMQTVGIYDQYNPYQDKIKAMATHYIEPGETLMKLV